MVNFGKGSSKDDSFIQVDRSTPRWVTYSIVSVVVVLLLVGGVVLLRGATGGDGSGGDVNGKSVDITESESEAPARKNKDETMVKYVLSGGGAVEDLKFYDEKGNEQKGSVDVLPWEKSFVPSSLENLYGFGATLVEGQVTCTVTVNDLPVISMTRSIPGERIYCGL